MSLVSLGYDEMMPLKAFNQAERDLKDIAF